MRVCGCRYESVSVCEYVCLWIWVSVWAYIAVFGVSSRLDLSICMFLSVYLCWELEVRRSHCKVNVHQPEVRCVSE